MRVRRGRDSLQTPRVSNETASERWYRVALDAAPWWPAVSTLPVEELATRAAEFARRQERNAIHDVGHLEELFAVAAFRTVNRRWSTCAATLRAPHCPVAQGYLEVVLHVRGKRIHHQRRGSHRCGDP